MLLIRMNLLINDIELFLFIVTKQEVISFSTGEGEGE